MESTTVLANCVGTYAETTPMAALRPHFRCAWTNRLPDRECGAVVVVPDGCVDLLWRDGRFLVAGPDVTAARPMLRPGATILGLRFKPGAASRWLAMPLTEIVGRQVDMTDIWGRQARDIADRMGEPASPEEGLALMQALLADHTPSLEGPPQEGAAIFDFLDRNAHDQPRLGALAGRLDTSERTLRRRSQEFFGYGPKTLHRILRLQRFIASVRQSGIPGLADGAYASGYADQPHLNREIQSLCAMTAGELTRQLAA